MPPKTLLAPPTLLRVVPENPDAPEWAPLDPRSPLGICPTCKCVVRELDREAHIEQAHPRR